MVPTFLFRLPLALVVLPGSARPGDGDLPGEGGGEPKRESLSSSQ